MKKIFISYGDKRFTQSLKRLAKEAKALHRFDKVITYGPKDMPGAIKYSPLSIFKRGGGYWLWKPYIIYKTLQGCKDGDIVEYTDAGCHLQADSNEWKMYDECLKDHNAIFFQYRDIKYAGWEKFCKHKENNRSKNLHWTKDITIDYFRQYDRNDDFLEYNELHGCHIIVKRCPETLFFIGEWLRISILHPELIIDAFGPDVYHPSPTFNEHRHDQSIVTPLVYFYKDKLNIEVMPETTESNTEHAAVVAARIKDKAFQNQWERFKYFVKRRILHH